MDYYGAVKEFNRTFGSYYSDKPTVPDDGTIDLRMNLIWEEFQEVVEEIQQEDIAIPDLAKELADLLVVTFGMADAFGIPMDEVFKEVHRSNMSKLTKEGTVLRREDGKVLKSDQYSPAVISPIIEKALTE